MKSAWQLSLLALAAGALSVSIWAQGTDFSKIEFTAKKVASNLYMVSGSPNVDVNHPDAAGGLVGVLAGPDGIFMVDGQYAQVSDKLLATIKKISPEPIRFMANTHIHGDHTAGNPFFGKMGVVIFAREELREQMIHPPRIRRRQVTVTVGEHAKADRDSPEFFVLRRVNESRRGSACDLGSAGIPAHPSSHTRFINSAHV